MAEEGSEGASHRPVTRRPDHQDPCSDGPDWPPGHPAADGRQRRRRHHGRQLMDAAGRLRCLIADKG